MNCVTPRPDPLEAEEMADRRRAIRQARHERMQEAMALQFYRLCREELPREQFEALAARIDFDRGNVAERELAAWLGAGLPRFLRELAVREASDPVVRAGVTASVRTLKDGIFQTTALCEDPTFRRKHMARLRSALLAMAEEIEVSGGR